MYDYNQVFHISSMGDIITHLCFYVLIKLSKTMVLSCQQRIGTSKLVTYLSYLTKRRQCQVYPDPQKGTGPDADLSSKPGMYQSCQRTVSRTAPRCIRQTGYPLTPTLAPGQPHIAPCTANLANVRPGWSGPPKAGYGHTVHTPPALSRPAFQRCFSLHITPLLKAATDRQTTWNASSGHIVS